MSRPRKAKREESDLRAIEDDERPDGLAAVARQCFIDRLRVDPKGDDPLSVVLASVLLGRPRTFDDELVGDMFVEVLRNPDPSVAEQFFRRVMKLKLNAAMPHRNSYAYYAYARFIEEAGREPSKPELRAYIEARRAEFKDAPGEEDGKGWTRLWDESGLSDLADKVGMKP